MSRLLLDRIIEGDGVAKMAALPEWCVGLVCAEPPYNLPLMALTARSDGVSLWL